MTVANLGVWPLGYEVEHRPSSVGGGWRLFLIGADPETGERICAATGLFPESLDGSESDSQAKAIATGEGWVALREAVH